MTPALATRHEFREPESGAHGHCVAAVRARDQLSFVMALWLEKREPGMQEEWRWRVTPVETGDQASARLFGDPDACAS